MHSILNRSLKFFFKYLQVVLLLVHLLNTDGTDAYKLYFKY